MNNVVLMEKYENYLIQVIDQSHCDHYGKNYLKEFGINLPDDFLERCKKCQTESIHLQNILHKIVSRFRQSNLAVGKGFVPPPTNEEILEIINKEL